MRSPIIKGVAPQLTIYCKVVGRHTSHRFGLTIFLELKEFWVCPNVGAVKCDKDRCVTHDFNTLTASVSLKFGQLCVKEVLKEDMGVSGVFHIIG